MSHDWRVSTSLILRGPTSSTHHQKTQHGWNHKTHTEKHLQFLNIHYPDPNRKCWELGTSCQLNITQESQNYRHAQSMRFNYRTCTTHTFLLPFKTTKKKAAPNSTKTRSFFNTPLFDYTMWTASNRARNRFARHNKRSQHLIIYKYEYNTSSLMYFLLQ
jgi:hypothetical protein